MEKITEKIQPLSGYRLADKKTNSICYADNIVLIAEKKMDITLVTHICQHCKTKYCDYVAN